MPSRQQWVERFKRYLTESPKDIGETRGYCPLHEDPESSGTPSASFNFGQLVFSCFSGEDCEWKGSFRELWSKLNKKGWKESEKNANKKEKPLPRERVIDNWHKNLLKDEKRMAWLRDTRGIKRKVLKQWRIGFRNDFPAGPQGRQSEPRFTIPIPDEDGNVINVRYYKPGETKGKMKNHRSHGGGALLGLDALEHDVIELVEGETDFLAGRSIGLNCMTHTAGAKHWNVKWSPLFKGKTVYIIYDCDSTGRSGAKKTAASLRKHGATVHIVNLGLADKGDLTDYIVSQGHTLADLRELMVDSEAVYEARLSNELDLENPIPVPSLQGTTNQDLFDSAIFFKGTVAGKADEPYSLMHTGNFTCDLSWTESKCANCEMSGQNGTMDVEIEAHRSILLELLDGRKKEVRGAMLSNFGVQPGCPRVDVHVFSWWSVEELFVIPSVDDRGEEAQVPIERRVYNVGSHKTPLNTTMQFTGVSTPDPRSQRSTLLTWDSEETQLALDKFEMTSDIRELLEGFQPRNGQSAMERLVEIAEDMGDNVTGIYRRPGLHIAYDLVWHSIGNFLFNGEPIGKGWVELMVLGDTRTGKSEAATKLMEHYRAGVLKSCEGASYAGLVGGSEKMGSGRMATKWGVIPLHDRRLVVLDEVSGMADKDVIGRMSSVRSSGKAQNVKMGGSETSARTRLIWISNPKEGTIADSPRGAIDALKELVPNPEDIARFDLAMAVSSNEVPTDIINSAYHKKVPHKFTSDMCSLLVTWAWSRQDDQVDWDEGAEDRVFEEAEAMGHEYIADPPLVQAENMRTKLARIAVAIAARLFSTKDGERVWVTEEHVEAAVAILNRLYGMESFGYQQYSKRVIRDRKIAHDNRKRLKQLLENEDDVQMALTMLMYNSYFKPKDLETYGNMDRDRAQTAIVELTRLRAIQSKGKGNLQMQPGLIQMLKKLEAEREEL